MHITNKTKKINAYFGYKLHFINGASEHHWADDNKKV